MARLSKRGTPVKIHTENSVWTTVDKRGAQLLNNELTYVEFDWKKGPYGRKKIKKETRMISPTGGDEFIFLTGLVTRALDYLEANNIPYEYTTDVPEMACDEPGIAGIEFRDYQVRLSDAAINEGRGVLLSPTGTGKSYIILRIMSAFTQENILFLVHTKDLMNQIKDDLIKFNLGEVGEYSGNKKVRKRIMVATIQTMYKYAEDFTDYFDLVIVDEGHHVASLSEQSNGKERIPMYASFLMKSAAPIKLALTATLPTKDHSLKALEALVGPVIGEYTMEEAEEDETLAEFDIEIITMPQMPAQMIQDVSSFEVTKRKKLSQYQIVYRNGIVDNVSRNMRLLSRVAELIEAGKSCMINIVNTRHGDNLMELIDEHFDFDAVFARGSTKNRKDIIQDMRDKKIMCVICTVIFVEGIDIPSLDVFVNAGGGRDSKGVKQKLGRALRKHKDKRALYIDTLDEVHSILFQQSKDRIETLKKTGKI